MSTSSIIMLLWIWLFRALDRRQEIKIVEHETDFYKINIFPCGIVYEVVVSSINGDSETDSDPQELFSQPGEWLKYSSGYTYICS